MSFTRKIIQFIHIFKQTDASENSKPKVLTKKERGINGKSTVLQLRITCKLLQQWICIRNKEQINEHSLDWQFVYNISGETIKSAIVE